MNPLLQLLLVSGAIAAMIVLRSAVERSALRQRLRDGTARRECCGGCGGHGAETASPEHESNADRSTCHAP